MRNATLYKWLSWGLTSCSIVLGSCSINFIQHDQNKAKSVAEEFGNSAFVRRDYSKAFPLLRLDRASDFTVSSLEKMVEEMYPHYEFPNSVHATEYEIVPSQKVVNVYLKGVSDAKIQFYCIVLAGDQADGYKVTEFYRREKPFPSTNLPRKSY